MEYTSLFFNAPQLVMLNFESLNVSWNIQKIFEGLPIRYSASKSNPNTDKPKDV
jgi:hypothetical protein